MISPVHFARAFSMNGSHAGVIPADQVTILCLPPWTNWSSTAWYCELLTTVLQRVCTNFVFSSVDPLGLRDAAAAMLASNKMLNNGDIESTGCRCNILCSHIKKQAWKILCSTSIYLYHQDGQWSLPRIQIPGLTFYFRLSGIRPLFVDLPQHVDASIC